ncbi:MAG TPA: tetratricopeptide repeat protein [Acidobacteriaceae bacterium]|nr:tetratricopeptide repeat protein [Acidobacteriaceae bacterium]
MGSFRRTRASLATFLLVSAALATPQLAVTLHAQSTDAAQLDSADAGLFQQGLDAQHKRDLATAENDYRELLARSSGFLPARFNLGLVLDAEGRTAEALDAFEAVVASDPGFPAVQMFAGIENFRLGRLPAAQTALELATRQSPENLQCWFWLARTDFAAGKTLEGKAAVDKALAISPEEPRVLYLLAQYQISAQDLAGAERTLTGLATRYPKVPDFHESLGSVYYLEARLDKAEEEYRTQLQLDANNPQAFSMLGVILLDRGQAKQSIEYLAKGLEANPRIAYLQRKIGQALLESGQALEAVEHLRQATALDPRDATAHFLLWKADSSLNRKTEAAAELEAFRKLQSQPQMPVGLPPTTAQGAVPH